MSGIPAFNIPAFDATAVDLRELDYEVVSPAELDDPKFRAKCLASDGQPSSAPEHSWGDLLARDVKLIADGGIQEIRVLHGWARSRGARLETFIGHRLCGIPILKVNGRKITIWRLAIAWVVGR